jgi:hypothetical protein
MKIQITLTEQELKQLAIDHIEEVINHEIDPNKLKIMVKSTQNYKSEWEKASYKLEYQEG